MDLPVCYWHLPEVLEKYVVGSLTIAPNKRELKHAYRGTIEPLESFLDKSKNFRNGYEMVSAKGPVFCQVSPCPPVLAGIQAQILEELSNTLEAAGRRLATEDSGSVLVVVNNSSRLGSDIKRDVAKIGEI